MKNGELESRLIPSEEAVKQEGTEMAGDISIGKVCHVGPHY